MGNVSEGTSEEALDQAGAITPSETFALSPLLNEIADCIGRDQGGVAAATAIGIHFGGRRLYIPRLHLFSTEHALVALIGEAATERLVRGFEGMTILIPTTVIGEQRRRAAAVTSLRAQGLSQTDIAHRLGIDRTTVQRLLRKHGDPASDLKNGRAPEKPAGGV